MAAAMALVPAVAKAATPAPHWVVVSVAAPTYFQDGDVGDFYELIAVNDGPVEAAGSISMSDALPPGVTATAIYGEEDNARTEELHQLYCPTSVTCEAANVPSGGYVHVKLIVTVGEHTSGSLTNTVTISGGGAQAATATDSTPVSSATVPFGASLTTSVTGEDGDLDIQAGSHPFGLTSIIAFNVDGVEPSVSCGQLHPTPDCTRDNADDARDLNVALPAGMVGDPLAMPRCTQAVFQTYGNQTCPADTQVGALALYFYGNATAVQYAPVYDIEPPPGQPAELGFTVAGFFHIPMFFHVRSNGDYGLTAQLDDISEADPVRLGVLRIWGVPASASHNSQRLGPECPQGCASNIVPKPFLTMPTSCTSEALEIPVSTDSWQNPEGFASQVPASIHGMTGCQALSFAPSLEIQPDTLEADTPASYSIDLQIPQSEEPEGLVAPDLRDALVTLPAGTSLSPAAANGLQGCSEAQFGIDSGVAGSCPPQSDVGEVEVITPVLEKPLRGYVYVAQPKCGGSEGQPACTEASAGNGELYGLDLEVAGSGVIVKLKGTVSANLVTGQLTTTFRENPQLPFSELKLRLNGGARAPLANPQACGTYTAMSDLTPWSAPVTPDAAPSSSFALTGCASPTPFAPSFSAGATLPSATASSPFTLAFSRHDGEQDLGGIATTLPPGLVGLISQVPLCGEPQASAGACPAASAIGTTAVAAGAGSDPLWLTGTVYLTGPYDGAPFGLSVVVPAQAGPFNLGDVVVRAAINVNPANAAVTVTSGPLPQIQDGVPVRLEAVDVTINRAGFMLDPSNCEQQSVEATIAAEQGARANVSSPFAVTGCKSLEFKPSFTASTQAKTSKRDGASLDVKVSYPDGDANIRSVKVDLPEALPSRLSTLQKGCTAAVFAANPANCPAESIVGIAKARTPILPVTLTGPVYLVSHGNEAFPNVVVVLQGDGVRIDLTGDTDIKKGITSSYFKSLPDVPVSSFELYLPEGRYSVLTANVDVCTHKLAMPTAITGQNGAVIKQTTKIAVSGCPKARRKAKKAGTASKARHRAASGTVKDGNKA
jgi:hypothetical protein